MIKNKPLNATKTIPRLAETTLIKMIPNATKIIEKNIGLLKSFFIMDLIIQISTILKK